MFMNHETECAFVINFGAPGRLATTSANEIQKTQQRTTNVYLFQKNFTSMFCRPMEMIHPSVFYTHFLLSSEY